MAIAASGSSRNWGARIRRYDWRGMPLVVLENETLRVGVLAGKGTDIVELNYKPRDLDFAWISPHGHPEPAGFASPWRDPLANGSALTLPPGETHDFWLEYAVLDDKE